MAYSELIKNFNRVRDYMREFYIYGFKSRDEYTRKSARSYDDEKRRLESWLGEHMQFRQNADGKNVFLSIDSRVTRHNPLYKAWKTKSFTDGDITLHFILFDILADAEEAISLNEILDAIDEYLVDYPDAKQFEESSVRKKLKEYAAEGLVETEKHGKALYYRLADKTEPCSQDVLDFFSEVAPCGVVGSFLLDKDVEKQSSFAFKHHYITSAMDSEILCSLFLAIQGKKYVTLETMNRRRDWVAENHVVPLKIRISVQSGRQYLMAYVPRINRINAYRIDNIVSVKEDEMCGNYDTFADRLAKMEPHMWGVSTQGYSGQRIEHVDFTIRYKADEMHIPQRLEREKRCGTIEKIDDNTSRFSADVYDAGELVPWIRTFICRITEIHFSDKRLEEQFIKDIEVMYAMYGLEGGEQS